MKSPFSGMDPFIEACGLWEDFHAHLIEHIYNALAEAVPDRYTVRTGERSFILLEDSEGETTFLYRPDVKVTDASADEPAAPMGMSSAEASADTTAVTVRAFIDAEYRETFVDILEDQGDNRLVTSIEVLSPANKRKGTPCWEVYQRKRQALLLGAANLVEIDLLRGGQRLPMLDPWPTSPYTILLARKHQAPSCRVWPAHYRQPLPVVPVPLLHPDPDIRLDLQGMVDVIYARSRYARSIDYTKPLKPPLAPEDLVWLKQNAPPTQRSGD